MIYATGAVTIVEDAQVKLRKKITRKHLTLELVEEAERTATSITGRYTYTAFLPCSYECRFLEDYTGKIKPFIERKIAKRVVQLQVMHLNYVSEKAMQNMKPKKENK